MRGTLWAGKQKVGGRGGLSRNHRYLNTVRPVALVPFQNAGSGAIDAQICNSSLLACSISGNGGLGNAAAEVRDVS